MSKLNPWSRLFQPEKEKVEVQVGDDVAEMTKTQWYRFDQLSRTWSAEEEDENPFEKSRYTIAEAALALLQDESAILLEAADGQRAVYVNGEGLKGRWRLSTPEGGAEHSKEMRLVPGFLEICAEPRRCAPAADPARHLADDQPGRVDAVRFDVFRIDARIADLRRREGHDLPGVGRIRQDLLIAGHRRIENHFPDRLAGRPERLAAKNATVC